MKVLKLLTTGLTFLAAVVAHGQTVQQTTQQVISSKAEKGGLYAVEVAESEIKLTYLLKQSKKKLDLETYVFDKNALSYKESKVWEAEPGSVKTEAPVTETADRVMRVYSDASGKPKIKLGYIQYTVYRRWTAQKFITTDELEPKGLDGEKVFYVHHRAELSDNNKMAVVGHDMRNLNIGDVQLVVATKSEPLYTSYANMVIQASDLTVKNKVPFTLPYSYHVLTADNLPNGDIALVFRPYTLKDIPKPEKSEKIMSHFKFVDKYHLRYVQVNPKGEVVKNMEIDFNEPESGYYMAIDVVPTASEDGVILMGSTRPLKILGPPLARMSYTGPKGQYPEPKNIYYQKADRLFTIKIKGNEVAYSNNVELESNVMKNISRLNGESAPGELKDFYGKFGQTSPVTLTYFAGKTLDVVVAKGYYDMQLVLMFLDKQGQMQSTSIVDLEGGALSFDPEFVMAGDGKVMMVTYSQPGVKEDASQEDKEEAAMQRLCMVYPLDLSTGKVSKGINLTPGGFIDPTSPFFFEDENTVITLGNGRKKEIILSRVKLQ